MRGPIFVFFSAVLFGSYGVWAVLLGSDFGVFFQGYVRALLMLILLVPLAFVTHSWQPLTQADYRAYAWCCGFAVFTQAPLYYAFQHAGVGIVSLVTFSVSLIVAYVIGAALLGEEITRLKLYSFFLGFVGLCVVFWNSLGAYSVPALMLAALHGVAASGEVSTTKLVPIKFPAIQTSIFMWSGIVITHLPLSLYFNETQLLPTLNVHWLSMAGFTLAGALGFWLVIEGYKTVDASVGGLIALLEIVFAMIFGAVFFFEKITTSMIVGSLIILCAALLPQLPRLATFRRIV